MNDCPNIINQNHIEFACQKILGVYVCVCFLCLYVCSASKLNVAADEFVREMEQNKTKRNKRIRREKNTHSETRKYIKPFESWLMVHST